MSTIQSDKRIDYLEKELEYIKGKLDDLTDMKLILTELKTISQYQAKRSDKLETMVEELSKTTVVIAKEVKSHEDDIHIIEHEVTAISSKGSIPFSEIAKYVLFAVLGIVITYVFSLPPK